jgi:hypothetical protein
MIISQKGHTRAGGVTMLSSEDMDLEPSGSAGHRTRVGLGPVAAPSYAEEFFSIPG